MKTQGLYGLVLAGGQSSRMRQNKALLDFHGIPQKDYLYQLLSKFCEQVFTSVGKNPAGLQVANPIPDTFDFSSPLNGIMSAFSIYPDVAWLSIPIDMPQINEVTINKLLEARDKKKVATCFYDSDGILPEPLLCIWEPQAFNRLKAFIEGHKISPREFLQNEDTHIIKVDDNNFNTNINTPEEYQSWKSHRLNENKK